MTVPPGFRRNSKIPKPLVLHKGIVQPQDVEGLDGYCVVTPLRAVLDLLKEGKKAEHNCKKLCAKPLTSEILTQF